MTPLFLRIRPLVALFLLPLQAAWAEWDVAALEKVEKQIQAVAAKTMPSVVSLSIKKKGEPPGHGTGIVISQDGMILTAGHMVDGGVDTFEVTFLDGKKARAKVLGADYEDDLALAKITDQPGPFPFVELRKDKELAPGEMVVSLGHTSRLDFKRKAPVRLGRYYELSPKGDLRSDCLMAGGDSGGPLFDLDGKVVGVHSQINESMTENFDVPVATVVKNWDRMLKGERWGKNRDSTIPKVAAKPMTAEELAGTDLTKFYQFVSEAREKGKGRIALKPSVITEWCRESGMQEERLKAMSDQDLIVFFKKALNASEEFALPGRTKPMLPSVPAVAQQDKEILAAVKPVIGKIVPSVVSLKDGNKTLALGTIVRADGFVLTKHSEIAKTTGALKARLSDGRELPAAQVRVFPEHDLALVKVAADSLPAVTFPESQADLTPGRFVFTPGTRAEKVVLESGIVSVPNLAISGPGGFLGLALGEGKDCVEVTDVTPKSPAFKAGLQKGDQILAIGDRTFQKPEKFSRHIRTMRPGAKIQLKCRRAREEKFVEIQLERPPTVTTAKSEESSIHTLGAEISDVNNGFPTVFQNDQTLHPEDCGSVLTDLHGKIVGINIARAGRTHSFAIPAKAVAEVLKTVDFDALAKQVTVP